MRVLVASRSPGKLREMRPLLVAAGYSPIDLASAGIPEAPLEDAIEMHASFESNALAKARHFFAMSGLPTLADDSGLCVDALGGRPGVRSKRWSERPDLQGQALDDANNALLTRLLAVHESRRAVFACAVAFVDEDGEIVRRGEARGRMLTEPQGGNGFGYDPYFWSDELECSFAVASQAEKARVSHRGRALRSVLAALAARR